MLNPSLAPGISAQLLGVERQPEPDAAVKSGEVHPLAIPCPAPISAVAAGFRPAPRDYLLAAGCSSCGESLSEKGALNPAPVR
jgi:hypothetical protein